MDVKPLRTILAHFLSVSFRTPEAIESLSDRTIAVGELSNHVDVAFSRGLPIVHREPRGLQFLFLEEGFVPVRLILISHTIPFSEMDDLSIKKLKSLVKEGHIAYYGIPWSRRAHCFVHLYDIRSSAVVEDGFFYIPSVLCSNSIPTGIQRERSLVLHRQFAWYF